MSTLKVRCPECNTFIRKAIDAVDEPTDFTLKCPQCGNRFIATAEPEARPAKATRRRDDDDDDDRPRRKKKQAAAGPNTKLIAAGVGGGLVVVGGIVALIIALSGPKDKNKDVAKNDPGPQTPRPQVPNPGPVNPGPVNPGPVNPGPVNPGPVNPGPVNPGPGPKQKEPADDILPQGLRLPDPPKIRVTGSAAPTKGGQLIAEKPPPFPPPTKEEDPFYRAGGFATDDKIPQPPKLPPRDQRPVLTLDPGGHTAFVKNVFITPKGEQVITVAEDKAVRVWDIKTGDVVHTIRVPAGTGDQGALHAAALSPDGKRLAVGGDAIQGVQPGKYPIFVINVEQGTLMKTINSASHIVTGLDFSSDGTQLAAGCLDGTVQVFNLASGNVAAPIPNAHSGPNSEVREVSFNPGAQKKLLATLGADGAVKVWDLTSRTLRKQLNVSTLKPRAIAWMNDGAALAVGGESGEILVFSASDWQVTRTVPKQTYNNRTIAVNRLQFLKGDLEIAYCGFGWAGVVSLQNGAVKAACTAHSNTVMGLNVSADGKLVVSSGGNQHETYVWAADTGLVVSRLCGTGTGIWGVGWAKDGKSLAWGTSSQRDGENHSALDGTFRFDDLGLGGPPDEFKYDQSLKADKTYAVVQDSKTQLKIGALAGQPRLFSLPGDEPIYSASVIPNKGVVVVCGARSLWLVNAATGAKVREFVGHTGNITAVAPSPDGRYFVTGSSDQTLRVWQLDREDPFLSIFVAGQEWIAWTPQGYYACSPHGEELIAWQVNNTAYKFPAVWPASRFRPSMYQPALIKYLIPAGDLRMALAMAQKFDKALVQTTNIADIVPPEVSIDSPAATETGAAVVVDQETFTVKATARGTKHPITAMKLLVDGRPFLGAGGVKRFDKPLATAEVTWDVPLVPGPHTFAVIAETGVSKNMSRVAQVTRSGEIPKPNLYVLAVGVSEYAGSLKLHFAASDAKMLAKAFEQKSKGLFGTIETKVLTDADATKKNFQAGLDWLAAKMTPKDVGVVMFSGHGTRDQIDRFFLVPVDIRDDDVAGSCLSGDEFKSRLGNMPGRLIAILDACHSGAVTENRRVGRADSLARDLASEDAGVIVMCSSLGREYSLESGATKAGFFTLGLVEGMCGHGDVDEDGVIYINELEMYTTARVRQLSLGRQNPTIGRPASIRPFPLATVPKSKKP